MGLLGVYCHRNKGWVTLHHFYNFQTSCCDGYCLSAVSFQQPHSESSSINSKAETFFSL